MDNASETEWSDAARLIFNWLSIEVQAGFIEQLPDLVTKCARLYDQKSADKTAVGTVPHMQPGRRRGSWLGYVATTGYRLPRR